MTIEITRVSDRYPIWRVDASDRRELAMTFVRFQECYESSSPQFRGKVFTLSEYRRWYSENLGGGRFTYASDWVGFNVPGYVIVKVRDEFRRHSKLEKALLRELDKVGAFADSRFYVIGTCRGENREETLQHELRHGLYYCSQSYRRSMLKVLTGMSNRRLREKLRSMGYSDEVLDDEVHAFALTGWPSEYEPGPDDLLLKEALRRVERRYL